jgi:hypothetical protein
LHPAAADVLLDALREAPDYTQVIVTTHSAELLDDASIHGDELLAAAMEQGRSLIASVDSVCRPVLEEGLYTAGELLWANQPGGLHHGPWCAAVGADFAVTDVCDGAHLARSKAP